MDAFLDSLPAASGVAADWAAPGGLVRQNEALVVPTQVGCGAGGYWACFKQLLGRVSHSWELGMQSRHRRSQKGA